MRRREFITLVSGAAAIWPLAARAQHPAMPVVGFLSGASPGGFAPFVSAFLQGLKDAGYVEGTNVTVDQRWAEGQIDRLPALAAELVHRQVAAVVASGGDAPALAVKAATTTIPIIFITGGDPVRAGLIASLNRPGGNVTGVSFIASALIPKRLELLHELVPKATAIGALVNPHYPDADLQRRGLREATAAIGLQLHIVEAGTQSDIEAAFASLAQQEIKTLLVVNDPFFNSLHDQIIALAARHDMAASYSGREYTDAGGLMSYGPSLADVFRQAGRYTGKVLSGTKTTDLPVIQPTKFELVINLKTAKSLGLTVPQNLLVSADEVIE